MTDLSGLWVKRVTPLDDGFIPYTAPSYNQYNPNLVPACPQPKERLNITPRTTRSVTLEPKSIQSTKRSKPVIKHKSLKTFNGLTSNSRKRHPTNVASKLTNSTSLPMGPDVNIQAMGPDIAYRPYNKPFKEVKFQQYITPYREYGSDETGGKKLRPLRRRKRDMPKDKAKEDARMQEEGSVPQEASVMADADAWEKPYELAGEAAVLSWIRMQEQRGNRGQPHYAFNRYDIQDNPDGTRASLKRMYGFHDADF